MGVAKFFVFFLLMSITTNARSRHHHGYYSRHRKENSHVDFVEAKSTLESDKTTVPSELLERNEKRPEATDSKGSIPFSARRLEKMMEKAILKIITGDLSTADMLLLKSFNYTLEEVLAIRERELDRRKDEELKKIANFISNDRKFHSEDLYGTKAKDSRHNSMEFDSSSRRDPDVEESRTARKKNRYKERTASSYGRNFDFDAYNRQAVLDYENMSSNIEQQQSWSEPANSDYEDEPKKSEESVESQNLHQSFNSAMEPHVIFTIRYNDSEFDSSSGFDERSKFVGRDALASKDLKHHPLSTLRHTTTRNIANSFHASSLPSSSFSSLLAASSITGHTPLPIIDQLRKIVTSDHSKIEPSFSAMESSESNSTDVTNTTSDTTHLEKSTNDSDTSDADKPPKKISEYEGLEWVVDDVYRVIPEYADSLGYDNVNESEMSDYEEQNLSSFLEASENDTLEYQNETPDQAKLVVANASMENASQAMSDYQQLALANRRRKNVRSSSFDSLSNKTLEDIKAKILVTTGKVPNITNITSQVRSKKLASFSPTCLIPRNTDSDAWMDPFSMNMHFQSNLTSEDQIHAGKLRLYVLPQENLTSSASGSFDEDMDDEKKIKISVYYYTKSLKKHRSKKRLLDSVVVPLTANGTYLAMDVKQCLRFWRLTSRNPHGNGSNHGLVVQVEDLDDRPLKPALYIQQPFCRDRDFDQKAFEPALFVGTCSRYVRIVNGERERLDLNCPY